jgi:hypothetical protein
MTNYIQRDIRDLRSVCLWLHDNMVDTTIEIKEWDWNRYLYKINLTHPCFEDICEKQALGQNSFCFVMKTSTKNPTRYIFLGDAEHLQVYTYATAQDDSIIEIAAHIKPENRKLDQKLNLLQLTRTPMLLRLLHAFTQRISQQRII